MSPLDAIPHVLIVYRTPGEDEEPQSRWESPGIQTVTRFDTRPEAEAVGKQVSAYTGVEWDVVKLDEPLGATPQAYEPTSIVAMALELANLVLNDEGMGAIKQKAAQLRVALS